MTRTGPEWAQRGERRDRLDHSSRGCGRIVTPIKGCADSALQAKGPATTAQEDTVCMVICDGSVLYCDDNGFTGYTNWETIEKLKEKAGMAKSAE